MNENRALYNCIDSAVTFKVWQSIIDELFSDKPGYEACYRQTMDLYNPAIFMSTDGLKLDTERLECEKSRVSDEVGKLEAELDKITNGKLNPNSPKSCQAYFYGYLGLQPYTNDGRVTTDDKAMARIARRGYKEASFVQSVRSLKKLGSTYLDVRTDSDGRIRASWKLRGTGEGRLSSAQNIFGTGLNFQNLDPRFKGFIVADPGYVFVEIDKKQAEWVVTAYLCGDARMLEVIERGLDPHIYTASLICKAPIELLTHESKIVGHQTDPDTILQLRHEQCKELLEVARFLPRSMSGRQAGKKGNHALNYREGYVKFALVNEIPETESKSIVTGYRTGYCNLPIWWDQTENELRKTRILTNCFGRVRRFLDEWGDTLIRSAIAFRPQSTVADLTSRGMIATYYDDAPYMKPLRLGAHGHDSLFFQYPISSIRNLAKTCLRVHHHMNPTLHYSGRDFTIGSELKFGYNWGDHDRKSNPEGMLEIPFPDNEAKLTRELTKALTR